MPSNRQVKKLLALVLAGAAVAMAAVTGAQALGASGRQASPTAQSRGYPHAVPPILRRLRPSELAELTRVEAQEAQAFYSDPPATARYSSAELNAYPRERK